MRRTSSQPARVRILNDDEIRAVFKACDEVDSLYSALMLAQEDATPEEV